jgi:adenosylcobinamide hydrolase
MIDGIAGVTVTLSEAVLHVASERPLTVLSSSVIGAELETTRHILNMHVAKDYRSEKPEDDLLALARALGIDEPFVGMQTAARLRKARSAAARAGDLTVAAIVTVGLSNPTAAGVSVPSILAAGTINLIVLVDGQLTRAAQVNAVLTATEAKTLALIDGGTRTRDGGCATGTSTDSIVLASTGRGDPLRYAGTATELGWLIGRTVRESVTESMRAE